jgi:hypothetical protein
MWIKTHKLRITVIDNSRITKNHETNKTHGSHTITHTDVYKYRLMSLLSRIMTSISGLINESFIVLYRHTRGCMNSELVWRDHDPSFILIGAESSQRTQTLHIHGSDVDLLEPTLLLFEMWFWEYCGIVWINHLRETYALCHRNLNQTLLVA